MVADMAGALAMTCTDENVRVRCACGGKLERRAAEVTMTPRDEEITFTGVPQIKCGRCNSRFYSALVLASLEAAMRCYDVELSAGN